MREIEKREHGCQRCGAKLSSDAPEGLCPRCLMALNLATQTRLQEGETNPAATGTRIPRIDEIAKHFPQLEILECLGRGGMGVVYKARQPRLNRLVALKILAPEREKDSSFATRFEKEAQALAQLSHPNIVTIHDFGESGGMFYLLMEFVDGVTLRQLLNRERLVPSEALAIVPQICEALQFAHDHGIVHRDIKPENILLDRRGRVKVADFGLAKLVGKSNETPGSEGTTANPAFTEAGKVMGTPQYMAPEQISHPAEVDHRADIYAVGVVFYQLLTGELPGKKFEPPSAKVQVDVRLDEVVLRALQREPELRYQQASELKTRVETIAHGERATTTANRAQPLPSLWKTIASIVGVLFFAGTSLGFCLDSLMVGFRPGAVVLCVMLVVAPIAGLLMRRRVRAWREPGPDGLPVGRPWFLALAISGLITALPVIGFATFFAIALYHDRHWNPTPMEAIVVPLSWFGAVLLPIATRILFREANPAPKSRILGTALFAVSTACVLLIVGSGSSLLRHHFSTDNGQNTFTSSTFDQDVAFGPVVEREITVGSDDRSFYSFDTENYVAPPTDFDPTDFDNSITTIDHSKLWNWLTANNVDVFAQRVNGKPVIAFSDMVTVLMNENEFDRMTFANLQNREEWKVAIGAQVRPSVSNNPRLGSGRSPTIAFQTRYDQAGMLRVEGIRSNPPRIVIRYKLATPRANAGMAHNHQKPSNTYPTKRASIIELILPFHAVPEEFVDFEKGTLVTLPASISLTNVSNGLRWFHQSGADAVAMDSPPQIVGSTMALLARLTMEEKGVQHGPLKVGDGCVFSSANQDDWENFADPEIRAKAAAATFNSSAVLPGAKLASYFLFKTSGQRIGVLQVVEFTDQPPGLKVRYKILPETPATIPAASIQTPVANKSRTSAGKRQFGPAMERVINATSVHTNSFLDLDSGELITPPDQIAADFGPEDTAGDWTSRFFGDKATRMKEWPDTSGADIMVGAGHTSGPGEDKGLTMFGGLSLAFVNWDTSAEDIVKTIQNAEEQIPKATSEPMPFSFMRPGTELPKSFAFKTREGTVGVLEILAFIEQPRGVRVRYKIVEPTVPDYPRAWQKMESLKSLAGRVEKAIDRGDMEEACSTARKLVAESRSYNRFVRNTKFEFAPGFVTGLSKLVEATAAGDLEKAKARLEDLRKFGGTIPYGDLQQLAETGQAPQQQNKRQRFTPDRSRASETSWSVMDQPSTLNPEGWAIMAHIALDGVVPARMPGETVDFCRIKMVEGSDEGITLRIENVKEKTVLTLKLMRDQPAELLIDGKGYRVVYPSTYVALKDADTTPFALVIVTRTNSEQEPENGSNKTSKTSGTKNQ